MYPHTFNLNARWYSKPENMTEIVLQQITRKDIVRYMQLLLYTKVKGACNLKYVKQTNTLNASKSDNKKMTHGYIHL